MNFLEAVKNLKDGECKGIKRVSWDGKLTRETYTVQLSLESALADDWELVDPTPQMEMVEVNQWAVIDTTTGRVLNTGSKEHMEKVCDPRPGNLLKIIELAGHYSRPVKMKVKKTKLIRATFDGSNFYLNDTYNIPTSAKIWAEWEEDAD